jgi:hypothetical protein
MRAATTWTAAVLVMIGAMVSQAHGADLKPIKTQKTKDLSVSVLNESGRWGVGKNDFVLAFTKQGKPVDVGKVTLNTSMPMPGMTPMLAGATLQPDTTPGHYRGTITFPDRGERQVTVTWDGAAGKGSTKFSVPVR